MFHDFNEDLVTIKERKRRSDKLKNDLKETENMLTKEKNRLEELKISLSKEGKDIEKLEGFSLKGLFHTFTGNKEELMEKEREEYLAAKLKYDGCLEAVGRLTKVSAVIKVELEELAGVYEQYDRLIREKEKFILGQEDENTIKLINLIEEATDLREDAKELQEAISAGEAVLNGTDRVIEQLSSARSWGAWDMLGGGLIATAIKHSRINAAQESMGELQELLQTFYKELKDVDLHETNVSIEISSFLSFADYLLDGLFVDWMVQSKIVDSLSQAYDLDSKIKYIIARLQEKMIEKLSLIRAKEVEKGSLIERL